MFVPNSRSKYRKTALNTFLDSSTAELKLAELLLEFKELRNTCPAHVTVNLDNFH